MIDIIPIAARYFQVTPKHLLRADSMEMVRNRRIMMWILKTDDGRLTTWLARKFCASESTVRHGVLTIERAIEWDDQVRRDIGELRDLIWEDRDHAA